MDSKPKVLYLTYHGIMDSVFGSQVLAYVLGLRRQFNLRLLAMDSIFKSCKPEYIKQSEIVRNELENNCILTTHLPFFGSSTLRFDAKKVIAAAKELTADNTPLIIHCRAQVCGYLGVMAKKALPKAQIKVITDVRGAAIEEMAYEAKKPLAKALLPLRIAQLRSVEKTSVTGADAIFAVSFPLMDYLAQKYPLPPVRKVIPTCANVALFSSGAKYRDEMRKALGLNGRFTVVYSGSLASWHLPDRIAGVFMDVKKVRPDSVFLVVTKDTTTAEKALKNAGLGEKDFIIRSSQYTEVPKYLSAADLALLVRDRSIVNAVACPTKFAEYLSAGLAVAVSSGIGDTEKIVRERRLGIIIDGGITAEAIDALVSDSGLKQRAVETAKEIFDLESGIKSIVAAYEELLGKN